MSKEAAAAINEAAAPCSRGAFARRVGYVNDQREEKTMFLHTDPEAQLDLYHQRSDELIRQAADYRRARSSRGRHRRFGRWPRREGPAA
jgi:hypothetical protein